MIMKNAMPHRPIPRTDMTASIIGLGAEHLDRKPYSLVESTIHKALDQDINIMDVFMPGEEIRQHIGRAIKGRRDKILLQGHIGSVDLNQQYDISRDLATCRKYFEALLKHLQTDYIDFGMLFFIDSLEDYNNVFETNIIDYVENLKKAGTIRSIGASSHNPITAQKVVKTGLVDLLMFSINPAFDMTPATENVLDYFGEDTPTFQPLSIDPSRQRLYQICQEKDVAITVMKTLGAGKLLQASHSPFSKPLSVAQCIHYALSRPAVVSALIGCSTPKEVEEALTYLEIEEEAKDYTAILNAPTNNFKGHCVYCNHCLPCPSQIDIAQANKYLDIALLTPKQIPPSIRQHYSAMPHTGKECIACGNCEKRCPFGVPIIENMQRCYEAFGK